MRSQNPALLLLRVVLAAFASFMLPTLSRFMLLMKPFGMFHANAAVPDFWQLVWSQMQLAADFGVKGFYSALVVTAILTFGRLGVPVVPTVCIALIFSFLFPVVCLHSWSASAPFGSVVQGWMGLLSAIAFMLTLDAFQSFRVLKQLFESSIFRWFVIPISSFGIYTLITALCVGWLNIDADISTLTATLVSALSAIIISPCPRLLAAIVVTTAVQLNRSNAFAGECLAQMFGISMSAPNQSIIGPYLFYMDVLLCFYAAAIDVEELKANSNWITSQTLMQNLRTQILGGFRD